MDTCTSLSHFIIFIKHSRIFQKMCVGGGEGDRNPTPETFAKY